MSAAPTSRRVVFAGVPLAICAFRLVVPSRGLDRVGPLSAVDAAVGLALAAWLLLLAYSLGCWALDLVLRRTHSEGIDRFVFASGLGFGALGAGLFVLGMLGGFGPGWIALALSAAGYFAFGAHADPIGQFRALARGLPDAWRAASIGARGMLVAAGLIGLLSSVQALAPTWDYDGLMYHLQAPRLFLEAGRVTPLPEIWQANGPLTIEMLYGVALGLQSEPTARLIHLILAGLLVLATYALARSELGETGGVLAAAVLLGIPIFPIWGTLAYADMGWALFEFLMVFALVRWSSLHEPGWLVLGGLFAGLAASTKYLGLAGLLSGVALVALSGGIAGVRSLPRSLARFTLPALAVCAPWYLRNAILLGDPVYPFLSGGGMTWGDGRLTLLLAYLRSFGAGTSPADLALLPIRLYTDHGLFGTFMSSIEFPSFFFPLALLLLITRPGRSMRFIGAFVLLRFGAWALGSQQTRFLLPVFPALSVLTAAAMLWLGNRRWLRPFARVAGMGFVGGMVAVTLAYQLIYFGSIRPGPVVLGMESRRSFLNRAVYDFEAARYVVEQLPVDARVLMLWDGQGYYCDERCLPDTAQSRAPFLMPRARATPWPAIDDPQITHVLIDLEGANFMVQHDPTGQHQASLEYIRQALDRCGELVLSTEKTLLYAWQCDLDIDTLKPEEPTAGSSELQPNIIRSTVGQARVR